MRRLLVLTVAGLALAVSGPAFAATKTVQIKASGFVPTLATIKTGDTIRWVNADTKNHQVVSNRGNFVSGILRPGAAYLRTFNASGTYHYHDGLYPAEKGTIKVEGPPPSISIFASQPIITFGTQVGLSGVVSSLKTNETVEVYAQEYGQASFVLLGTVLTTANGAWGFTVQPKIMTMYKAKWGNRESTTVITGVQPKLSLRRVSGWFVVRAQAARPLARRTVTIQRLSSLGQWVSIKRVTLNASGAKRFKLKLRKGVSRLRVALSVNQAGPGYLGGFSSTLLFRRG